MPKGLFCSKRTFLPIIWLHYNTVLQLQRRMILIRTIRRRMRSYTNYLYYWKRWAACITHPISKVGDIAKSRRFHVEDAIGPLEEAVFVIYYQLSRLNSDLCGVILLLLSYHSLARPCLCQSAPSPCPRSCPSSDCQEIAVAAHLRQCAATGAQVWRFDLV